MAQGRARGAPAFCSLSYYFVLLCRGLAPGKINHCWTILWGNPGKLTWPVQPCHSTTQVRTDDHLFLVVIPTGDQPERQSYSFNAACSAHVVELQSDPSSKTVYRDIKVAYSCEPYIRNCSNKHLRRIIAQ